MIDVATSGSEVPAATMVRPTISSWHAEERRDRHRGADERLRTEDEQREAAEDVADVPRPMSAGLARHQFLDGLARTPRAWRCSGAATARPGTPCRRPGVRTGRAPSTREMPRSEDSRNSSIVAADHHRHFLPDQLRVDDERCDHRGGTENEEDVEDVAADHVADRDVDVAAVGCSDGNRHFRGAGTERDDGEPDHQRRDAERKREPARAAHQCVGAGHEQHESDADPEQLHQHVGIPGPSAACAAVSRGAGRRSPHDPHFRARAGRERGTARARPARSSARCPPCARARRSC